MNKEVQNQISRMKTMMTYGLTTENKNCQFSNVEFDKVAANGKHYAIIREGSKYYIKVSDKKEALKEDYNYIGGFCNRSKNEFNSYANALKQFELKLMSINENYKKTNGIVIESWNPYKKEELAVESTEKMRKEIARQREIIKNATKISEGKNVSTTISEECVGKECAATQKNNLKKSKVETGLPTGKGGDPFTVSAEEACAKTQKTNNKKEFKPVVGEGKETLGWNDDEDYLDTASNTEIGSSAPFEDVVEECDAMHNCDNQNNPKPGVGEVGDDDPFTEYIHESFHNPDVADDEQLPELPEEVILDDEDFEDDDFDMEDEDFDMGDEDDFEDDEDFEDEELEDGFEDDSFEEPELDVDLDNNIESRLSSIEDAIAKISDKLGVDEFEDDSLYDDNDEDFDDESDDEVEFEVEMDNENEDEDFDMEDEEDDDLTESVVIETPAYKRMMREEANRMDYFGKHPAYRKEVMTLPSSKHSEKPGYYDMNDDSVEYDGPFGQEIGSSAPFTDKPQEITNAIAEAVQRVLARRKKF